MTLLKLYIILFTGLMLIEKNEEISLNVDFGHPENNFNLTILF